MNWEIFGEKVQEIGSIRQKHHRKMKNHKQKDQKCNEAGYVQYG